MLVPVAIDEVGGFAGFRETATKTNSVVGRLQTFTLTAFDDIREGLESYIETTAQAEILAAKIERTDDIGYELYGLTDEEIGIASDVVGEWAVG